MPKFLLRILAAFTVSAALGAAACGGAGGESGNHPPVALDEVFTLAEDTLIEFDALANDRDLDGDQLTVTHAVTSGHETKIISGRRIAVTTPANFNGQLELSYTVSDGLDVAEARAIITVTPVNDAPAAAPVTVHTGLDLPVEVALAGTDVDGDTLAYEIVTNPSNGTLSGTAPALTYTPRGGFYGADVFSYRVRDAEAASAPVAITVEVDAGSPPVVDAQTVVTLEDTTKSITLTGSDPDGDPITFAIVQSPAHGALTGTPPTLTYTPAPDYNGSDSFRFTANNGTLTSATGEVSIDVTAQNDPPVVLDLALTLAEDTTRTVNLTGTDPENDTLTYAIVTPPAHGALIGTGSTRTYTPALDFHGDDTFTFTVSDGQLTSALTTVTLVVESVPDGPVATGSAVAATEDTPTAITLAGTDGDGDDLTFAITGPAHGTLSGTPPALTYAPAANYNGNDTITFTVSDGQVTSALATIAITVAAVDDPPVIASATMTGPEGEFITIPVPATDADGEALTYNVVEFAPHGSLFLAGPEPAYREFGNFNGVDSFTLTATDGHTTSAPATFTVTVTPTPDAPFVREDLAIAFSGQDLRIDVLANDVEVDGEPMTIDSVTAPTFGAIEIDGDALVYTPAEGNAAPDTFTYTVRDPGGLTGTATVTIGIGEFPSGLPPRLVRRVTNNAQMLQHDVSADGRYVAFLTHLPIGSGDTNGLDDAYVWDRMTGTFERISVDSAGAMANGASERPSISGDGRYVAFASAASNLVAGDTNGVSDVFVRDRVQHTTVRISVGPGGSQVSGASNNPDISADGRVVAFQSFSFQLIPSDANGVSDVFVRDLVAETTSRVSIRTGGGEGDSVALSPAISGDGHVVAFTSAATNLVDGDTNNISDVFVHDRTTGVTERVSVSSTGLQANSGSSLPAISFNGRFVAFRTFATNLVPGVSVASTLVRDRQGVTTTHAFPFADSLSLSGDGRYLAGHLSNGSCFVRDRFASLNHFFSESTGNDIYFPVLTSNGRYVAFISSSQLIPGQGTNGSNLYLYANPL